MASKSKSRRRVFRASCILAALIVAGSSFAWFSSKDEVTNRLSASANYGVSIVEDFQPPKNWLPGQKINKDVSVVNTGNVDAFVRTWVDGEMSLIAKSDWDDSVHADDEDSTAPATLVDFSGDLDPTDKDQKKLTNVNLNWYNDGDGTYYKELSQIKSENPKNSTTSTATADEDTNQLARFSEVQSIQAGGVLVYHGDNANFYYVLEQATTIEGYEYDTTNSVFSGNKTTKTYPAGTFVCTTGSVVATNTAITGKVKVDSGYYGNIDTSEFYPESEGLYLFRRNVKLDSDANAEDDYEYTGYYFFNDADKTTTTATAKTDDISENDKRNRGVSGYPVYLALCYDTAHAQRSDYVLPDSAVTTNTSAPTEDEVLPVTLNDVRLYTATEKILTSYNTTTPGNNLKWTYTPAGDLTTYTLTATSTSDETDTSSVVTTGNDVGTIVINSTTYYVKANKLYHSEADAVSGAGEVSTITGYDLTPSTASGSGTAGTGILSATYGTGDKLVKVNVYLNNLNNSPDATTAETWSVIENVAGNDKKWTFYYNNDVEEGASTTKLIDYVELDKTVKDEAFLAFDFDLNVFMESAQVVIAEDGSESGDPIVTPWTNGSWAEGQDSSANTNYNEATATTTVDGGEISLITWAVPAP